MSDYCFGNYDSAWKIARVMEPFIDKGEDAWAAAAQETEYSLSTCRQAIQALRKARC